MHTFNAVFIHNQFIMAVEKLKIAQELKIEELTIK